MFELMQRGWDLAPPPGEIPTTRVLFQGNGYRVGAVRVSPGHPRWRRLVDNHGWAVIQFPRVVMRVDPVRGEGGVVDPGCAFYLDAETPHRPTCLTAEGDRSDWFSFSHEFVERMLPGFDRASLGVPGRPMRFLVDEAQLALQRRAFREALEAPIPDELLLEEALCTLLGSLARLEEASKAVTAAHGALAYEAQAAITGRFRDPIRLHEIASALGVSTPHLCRIFRAATGRTLYAYRERLRLAAALERLEDRGCDLTALAFDLGYSSHAHFTTNFRRAFGIAPSAMRGNSRRLSAPAQRRFRPSA